ncbi:pentapeptide repeat-containing protein [Nocardia sp. NRRL S-836]|uniref:pentapeptide repeat-containing protein n=1 Tax=Nocardia sp. NRRL S-836 TaxID=1519492 RepID=UPI0012F86F8E|nr:pentapeptide repeat-containing protein [Nocardia sp. NRRL S-836]
MTRPPLRDPCQRIGIRHPQAETAAPDPKAAHAEAVLERDFRLSVQRLLAKHLRLRPHNSSGQPHQDYWHEVPELDLTEACLIDVDLSNCHLPALRMNRAAFSGRAWFDGVTFTGGATFKGARFTCGALCSHVAFTYGATFASDTWFSRVAFTGSNWFGRAALEGHALFGDVTITDGATFGSATFNMAAKCHRARVRLGRPQLMSTWPQCWTLDTADPEVDDEGRGVAWCLCVRPRRALHIDLARFASS